MSRGRPRGAAGRGALSAGRPLLQRWALGCLLALALALQAAGCASYTTRLRELRPAASQGDWAGALAQVEKKGRPGELLYHLERGALLRYAGSYAESNEELDRAAQRLDELYTISLSQRGLTFLLSDESEDYRGEVHEGNYLHYLRVLNYLELGDRRAAAVEARRLAQRLAFVADTQAGRPAARGDPFLHYLSGAVLEDEGEWNHALVSYRLALEGWSDPGSACGGEAPAWLAGDLARAAVRAGVSLEEIGLGDLAASRPVAPREGKAGTLLLFFESGWAPMKTSEHLRLPIFAHDPEWRGEDGARAGGAVLAQRVRHRRERGEWAAEPAKVAYFLDVALPLLGPARPGAAECRASLLPLDGEAALGGAFETRTAAAPAIEARTAAAPMSDLACRVRDAFAADEAGVIVKTIARALLKYWTARKAEKQGGPLAGILANIAGVATEKADTRAWLMLPSRILGARLELPPGRYRLRLEARDGEGRVVESGTREIQVDADARTLIAWRSFAL
ncbi:MAG: hypothetical protein FJY75_02630 [Candidatus Eisenbacteria bacterium]|uniref:Tetratricopeptide repeat protein n=1 Tax=Eiseniibacteriota bacterium TaxID=2212470 RepID=A0A938BPZ3_UNCEI|nr:hypothetical protein [Candidatus Eisenbacteria bacterium]